MSQIPGVPLGAKIERVSLSEYPDNHPQVHAVVTLAPADDNPYGKFLHLVEADIKAAGRERLGGDDYRHPLKGEHYWSSDGLVQCRAESPWPGSPRLILKPLKRRVLVAEFFIGPDGRYECATPVGGASFHAEALVAMYPKVYRIEERDV